MDLIQRNPENHLYFNQLCVARQAASDEAKLALFAEMGEKFPKSSSPKRLSLNIAQGAQFRTLVDAYMRKALRKGIPPLFVDLRPLFEDGSKAVIIEELCQGYYDSLNKVGTFDSAPGQPKEPSTAMLWLLYFMGQLFDHKKDFKRALEIVDEAINHTPTLIELYMLKGKIFKHVGNFDEAVNCLDEAQSLDTADRYINCKCAKYMLRANRIGN